MPQRESELPVDETARCTKKCDGTRSCDHFFFVLFCFETWQTNARARRETKFTKGPPYYLQLCGDFEHVQVSPSSRTAPSLRRAVRLVSRKSGPTRAAWRIGLDLCSDKQLRGHGGHIDVDELDRECSRPAKKKLRYYSDMSPCRCHGHNQ